MQPITAHHKAIAEYYRALEHLREQGVSHEMATRSAFQGLLAALAPAAGWTLIPELTLPNGKRPDGTLRDANTLPRGYWEAKDTGDDLETEMRKKIALGYPTINTIFEDTQHAVLHQKGRAPQTFDVRQAGQLADLLNLFFTHTEPEIETLNAAIAEFKSRIPELAQGLLELIRHEREGSNPAFQRAWAAFFEVCRTSLDPGIRAATVDEMLVQHLLTERLFRTVFDNPDFTRRNVIAVEIEKVIDALTSHAFNRKAFLQSLDRFYVAIEGAALWLGDWSEKQEFLDMVYERFFQGFSVKEADTRGIKYTPQEIVDFMCASVEHVLQTEFNTSLSQPGVQILDPATGTGNFIVNLIRRTSGVHLARKYAEDLFANEIMLLPYYIASLNIEHAYYARTGDYRPFEGICFADTLDLAEGRQMQMFVERNTERAEREKQAQIMVVIGNPPYNVGQTNENDNNRNRSYSVVDARIRETYVKDSKASSNSKSYDAYARFFRWATDRLGNRDGIVCLVSNNSFVDQMAFDGMRKNLLRDFTYIYHLDLHGNVRKNPKISGTSHNVFGIQVGVGITVAVRRSGSLIHALNYYRVPEDWRRERKLAFLRETSSIEGIGWNELQVDGDSTWLTEGLRPEFHEFLPLGTREAKSAPSTEIGGARVQTLFKVYSIGANTSRDTWTYDFNAARLATKVQSMIETYDAELSRWTRAGCPDDIDGFVTADETRIKWSSRLKECFARQIAAHYDSSHIRKSLYRPFTHQYLYFDTIMTHRQGMLPIILPIPDTEEENEVIAVGGYGRKHFAAVISNLIPDLNLFGDPAQCFPFYTYAEDGSNRRENITDWALGQFQAAYGAAVTKRDIFHYVYALLHHPVYRERYAENLKRELPHIPLVEGAAAFATCARIGAALAALHLGYERAAEYPLTWRETPGERPDWRVNKKMKLTPDKTAVVYNDWLTLAGIPAACFAYRLGNRSALEWVIDQYHVSTDNRSGITSDPNRADEPEYIARLVCRVVTVSVETVRLVDELAGAVALAEPAETAVVGATADE